MLIEKKFGQSTCGVHGTYGWYSEWLVFNHLITSLLPLLSIICGGLFISLFPLLSIICNWLLHRINESQGKLNLKLQLLANDQDILMLQLIY